MNKPMNEKEILNQINVLMNSLREINKIKHDVNLYKSNLEQLGFEKEYHEEDEFRFEKPINEQYAFWFEFCGGSMSGDYFVWGVFNNGEIFYESESFEDFDQCLKNYLNNKHFYQIKTLKVTQKISLLVDTRDSIEDMKIEYDLHSIIDNIDEFELEMLD